MFVSTKGNNARGQKSPVALWLFERGLFYFLTFHFSRTFGFHQATCASTSLGVRVEVPLGIAVGGDLHIGPIGPSFQRQADSRRNPRKRHVAPAKGGKVIL